MFNEFCLRINANANAHNYAFTVYNVISSSAKDNSHAFLCFFLVNLVTYNYSEQYFVAPPAFMYFLLYSIVLFVFISSLCGGSIKSINQPINKYVWRLIPENNYTPKWMFACP